MKILLLNPPFPVKVVREGRCQHEAAIWDSVYPPLALATLAAYLRPAHEVWLIDAIGQEMGLDDVLADLRRRRPDLIISSVSTPTIEKDLRVLAACREATGARTAIFGVHASYFAEDLVRRPEVDFVLLKDPEAPAAALASGAHETADGLAYLAASGPVVRPPRPAAASSGLIPAWDLVDLARYRIPVKGRPYVLVSTARGCPFDCSFCVVPFYNGRKVRYREADDVMAELRAIKPLVRDVFFYTDLFTFRKDYVLDLCRRMVEEDLRLDWICNSRVDTFDAEMARAMSRAGCWMVSFGLESGNQRILDLCGKKITLEQSRRAVAAAREAGLMTIGHFVLGFPGETQATLKDTLRFSRRLNPDFAEFYIATPFPGSRLYDDLRGTLSVSWSDIRYDSDPYGRSFDLAKIRRRAYLRFYLRPGKILGMLRLFGPAKIPALTRSAFRFLGSLFARG